MNVVRLSIILLLISINLKYLKINNDFNIYNNYLTSRLHSIYYMSLEINNYMKGLF